MVPFSSDWHFLLDIDRIREEIRHRRSSSGTRGPAVIIQRVQYEWLFWRRGSGYGAITFGLCCVCIYLPPDLFTALFIDNLLWISVSFDYSLSLKFSFNFVNFWICDWTWFCLSSLQFIFFWLSFLYIFYLCFLTWIICSIFFLQKRLVNWKRQYIRFFI